MHDFPHDTFSHCFFPGQLVNGLNHFGIGFPLVLQILGLGIVNVMLFGNLVKTVVPRVSSFQTFLQLGPRSDVLIPRPMKLDSSLPQPLLNVEPQTLLPSPSRLSRRRFPLSHCSCHSPVFFSDLLVVTNFPNLWRVEVFLHHLFLGTGLLMGVGCLDLNSFLIEGSIFTPDVDGVAGSTLIFLVDGGSGLILGLAPPGAGRSSP